MTLHWGGVCALLLLTGWSPREALLVVPEDVGTGLATVYGFTPRIVIGRDHRLGFGFRLGNHADLQLLYELGPQTSTAPLLSTPTPMRTRRRPVLALLLLLALRAPRAAAPREHHDTVPSAY